MEELIHQCSCLTLNSPIQTWYNNTGHGLYCIQQNEKNHVYSFTTIYSGEFIGYITGERKYSWETLPHSFCIWLNDSYVIDCGKTPRCITSMIREPADTAQEHNCEIAFSYNSESVDVYVIATKTIYYGEELLIKKNSIDEM